MSLYRTEIDECGIVWKIDDDRCIARIRDCDCNDEFHYGWSCADGISPDQVLEILQEAYRSGYTRGLKESGMSLLATFPKVGKI